MKCRQLIAFLFILLPGAVAVDRLEANGPSVDALNKRADYRRPDKIDYPEDNAYSAVKARLGQALFFDTALSGSNTISCSSCHNPELSWTDGQPRSIGEAHTPAAYAAPSLLNVAWLERLGWDGKFKDLEAVAFTPITSPTMMNLPEKDLIARLQSKPAYVELFGKAFNGEGVTRRNIELALATFERSIVSTEAPFDRWVKGDEEAISAQAKHGFAIFNGKGHCAECHSGWSFTDGSYHDIGTSKDNIGRGRYFPTSIKLQYAFKTPTLRDVALTAPYMHDGSLASLEDVIELYDRGGIDRPSRAEPIKPLHLSQNEKADLIAFLQTLNGDRQAPPQLDFPD